jgi:predicted O-methyltransferase YrrM
MTNYPNWFESDGKNNFQTHLLPLKDNPLRALQIGAYTGDASVWIWEHLLKNNSNSVLIDIDTWEGSDEPSHHQMNWESVESFYDVKTGEAQRQRKIIKIKSTSDWFFKNNLEKYNFIYIDGDHTSYGVLKDAVNAYECLNINGIIAFDDYKWSAGLGYLNEPKLAIDAFSTIYSDRLELLVDGYQRWYKKIG